MHPAWKCKLVTFSVLDLKYLTLDTLLRYDLPSVYFSFSFIYVIVGEVMQYPQYRDETRNIRNKRGLGKNSLNDLLSKMYKWEPKDTMFFFVVVVFFLPHCSKLSQGFSFLDSRSSFLSSIGINSHNSFAVVIRIFLHQEMCGLNLQHRGVIREESLSHSHS